MAQESQGWCQRGPWTDRGPLNHVDFEVGALGPLPSAPTSKSTWLSGP